MEAVKSGANSYIMKPFTPANLIQKVASVLGRRAHKRHSVPGTVTLHFGERFVKGRITGKVLSYDKSKFLRVTS